MTQKGTNRKISELRGWLAVKHTDERHWFLLKPDTEPRWLFHAQPCLSTEVGAWASGPDWISDALWPTLLRELPDAHLMRDDRITEGGQWCLYVARGDIFTWFPDPADAVLDAWIRWRESTAR